MRSSISAPSLTRAAGLLLLAGCSLGLTGPSATVRRPPADTRNVLFVGNSLTYVNALPGMVKALADSAGGTPALHVEQVAFPDFSLEDHWANGAAGKAIGVGGWHVVVMQQGASSLASSQANLKEWAGRFATAIREAGARPALYMVWPTADRLQAFDAVRASYSEAATASGGMFLPAGEAWREAWRLDPAAPLYSADGLHPTVAGSYAAALVIVGMLYDRSPVGLPARLSIGGAVIDIPPPLARTLQQAAATAIERYGRR